VVVFRGCSERIYVTETQRALMTRAIRSGAGEVEKESSCVHAAGRKATATTARNGRWRPGPRPIWSGPKAAEISDRGASSCRLTNVG
jgi:hypothetical protein